MVPMRRRKRKKKVGVDFDFRLGLLLRVSHELMSSAMDGSMWGRSGRWMGWLDRGGLVLLAWRSLGVLRRGVVA